LKDVADGGNKAILEHTKNGKTLHLFEYTKKAFVRYLGSAECLGYHEEDKPDREGNERKVFVFHLDLNSTPNKTTIAEPLGPYNPKNLKALKSKSLEELRKAVLTTYTSSASIKQKCETAFYRSEALKLYVVKRSKGKCEGCGREAPFQTKKGPFLESHHLHRLADGGPDHPENVVALCPNCHRQAHYATDAKIYNEKLKTTAIEAEKNAL
jgi:5-methylcytosine-specific restriction protein A